jgi:hypothetical protein
MQAALLIPLALMAAGSTLMQARAQKTAADVERAQVEDERKMAAIQADNEERLRREQLERTLSAQQAQSAAMGRDFYRSSTIRAVTRADKDAMVRDVEGIRLMARSRDYRLGLQSQGLKSAGKSAMIGGYLGAGQSLLGGALSTYRVLYPSEQP